jgi:hypothetical protein
MSLIRRVHAPVLTAALLPAFIAVSTPCAGEWRRIDTPNFVVVGDVSARTLRNVAVKFEGFRETLTRVLTERATATPVPTVVIVFPSDRAFTPFKPTYQGKPLPIAGLFVGRQDANYIAIVADSGLDGFRIVFHEYAHLVVSNVVGNIPAWLNEGLAEFYSTYEVSDGGREAVLGQPLIHHLQQLQETRLLKLDDLLTMDYQSPLYNERDRGSVFYAQSWALTHRILMGEPRRTSELFTYLQRLSEGTAPMQAWKQAFGAANLERELQDYVRRRSFQAVQYRFTDKLAQFDVAATVISSVDAEALLSEFLIQQRRPDEAAVRLSSAEKLEPNNVRVKLGFALLDVARADYDNAGKRLLALGAPPDWLVAYSAAMGISEVVENRRETPSREHVEATRQLVDVVRQHRAEVPNALARLAMVELRSAAGPTKETRATIERARLMASGRVDYAFVHAQILTRLSDFDAARDVVGPLMSGAFGADVRESARSLMAHIVAVQAAAQSRTARAAEPEAPAAPAAAAPAESSRTPDSGFQPIFRELQTGEQRMEGLLDRIECRAGGTAVFFLRTADGPARAAAESMAAVDFISYRDDLSGSISCGPMKSPLSVYLTWRAGTGKPDPKVAVAIEFLPK